MRLLIIVLALFCLTDADAQTSQGGWLLGGSAGLTSAKSNSQAGTSVLTMSINPIAGYLIIDDLVLGAGTTIESVTRQYFKIGAGPIIRYYFLQIGESANLITQTGFYAGSFNPKYGDRRTLLELSLDLGMSYFLNENVALETILNYTNTNATNYTDLGTTKARENRIGVSIGFQISLGGSSN